MLTVPLVLLQPLGLQVHSPAHVANCNMFLDQQNFVKCFCISKTFFFFFFFFFGKLCLSFKTFSLALDFRIDICNFFS